MVRVVLVGEGATSVVLGNGRAFIRVAKKVVNSNREIVEHNVDMLLDFITRHLEDGFLYSGKFGTVFLLVKQANDKLVIIEVIAELERFNITTRTIRVEKWGYRVEKEKITGYYNMPPEIVERIISRLESVITDMGGDNSDEE